MTVRLRYAPSPTGHLHIGGARTALFTYLYARRHGGSFILRIEDTDLERNVEGAAEEFFHGLRWLGIEWDEGEDVGGPYGPYRCTERMDIYSDYIQRLVEQDLAYPCYCTPEELERDRDSQPDAFQAKYSGRCRHLTQEQRAEKENAGLAAAIRLRVQEGQMIHFHDMIRGDITFETDGNDFVIVKSNGMPTYNLAVVIDDYLMKITHVTRGEEHISNTPRQILIYQAFGWEPPQFAHFNLILNAEGKKLSKRDESILQFIAQYRDLGYLPEAILNFLALLGWSPGGEQEIFTKEELIERFSFEKVNRSGSIFDLDKLTWMNGEYMKKTEIDRVVDLSVPQLQKAGFIGESYDVDRIRKMVALFQDHMTHTAELTDLAKMFFVDTFVKEQEAVEVLQEEQTPIVVQSFLEKTQMATEWSADSIKSLLKDVQKQTGYKGRALFMTVRSAVTGQTHGPDLFITLELLGRQRVQERLQSILV